MYGEAWQLGIRTDKAYLRQQIRTNARKKIVRYHEGKVGPSRTDSDLAKALSQKFSTNRRLKGLSTDFAEREKLACRHLGRARRRTSPKFSTTFLPSIRTSSQQPWASQSRRGYASSWRSIPSSSSSNSSPVCLATTQVARLPIY